MLLCCGGALLSFASDNLLDLNPTAVVARVNGTAILSELLDLEANLPLTLLKIKQTNQNFYDVLMGTQAGYDFLVEYKRVVLENLVDAFVLLELAKKHGVALSEDQIADFVENQVQTLLEENNLNRNEFEKYIITQGYDSLVSYQRHLEFKRKVALATLELMNVLFPRVSVTTADVQKFLPDLEEPASGLQSVHLAHILVSTQMDAIQALDAIGQLGFEEAARIFSIDELTRDNGGDLGWIEKGVFPQFDVAFGEKEGNVVGPILSPLGYHILLVIEFGKAEISPDTLTSDQKAQVEMMKRFELWQNWLQNEFAAQVQDFSIEILF